MVAGALAGGFAAGGVVMIVCLRVVDHLMQRGDVDSRARARIS